MDVGGDAEASPSSSDVHEYLQSTFQHPAGLQTARNLVKAVAKQMLRRSAHPPSTITTLSNASPEVEAILNDILAFRDSQSRVSQGDELGTAGVKRSVDPMDVDTAGILNTMAGSPTVANSSAPTSNRQTNISGVLARNQSPFSSSVSHSSLRNGHLPTGGQSFYAASSSHNGFCEKSPESEIRSIFGSKAVSNSLLQGTESPYRVESPAVQAANNSSIQQSAHRPHKENQIESYGSSRGNGGNIGLFSSASEWEDVALNRTQVSTTSEGRERSGRFYFSAQRLLEGKIEGGASSSASISSTNNRPSETTRTFTTASTAHLPPKAGLTTAPPTSIEKSSASIKTFIAVNTSATHHKDNTTAETHFQNATAPQPQVASTRAPNATPNQDNFFFSSLQSPSPPPSFATPQLRSSPNVTDLSSPNLTDNELDPSDSNPQAKMAPRKRKADAEGADPKPKKQKVVDQSKKATKKGAKSKEPKTEQANEKLPQAIFMRILEFTPPSFLTKARLVSKSFKAMVDEFDSIFVNCRRENYGWDMPSPPKGLTERQYSDLFGGKGCLEPGCTDTMSSRTHWSWAKRWCQTCWQSKIVREDRALKQYQAKYGRVTLTKLFECIPAGIHDSFLKPHDYNDSTESRNRQAPRLYKYYLIADIPAIISDYESLTPAPFVEDPNHTADQIASARAAHQILMDGLDEKRNEFFATRKKENDDHMIKVQKIEKAVKDKREENRKPHTENRDARKDLFSRRAQEELPHIPLDFVKATVGYKAATRIYRDPGSERGWQTLKPKIEKEWEEKKVTPTAANLDGVMEVNQPVTNHESITQAPMTMGQSSMAAFSTHGMFGDGSSITDLGSTMKNRNNSIAARQNSSGIFSNNGYRGPTNLSYTGGSYGSTGGFTGPVSNAYVNHPNHSSQFQHMMGAHNTNQYHNTYNAHPSYNQYGSQHGSYPGPSRVMLINSVLSDPFTSNPNTRQP